MEVRKTFFVGGREDPLIFIFCLVGAIFLFVIFLFGSFVFFFDFKNTLGITALFFN